MDTTAPPPTADLYQLLTVLIANWHVILEVVGGITLIATSVVANARGLVPLLQRLALLTATKADDRAVEGLSRAFERAADGIAWFARLVERWSWLAAPRDARDTQPRPPRPGAGGLLGTLTLCILLAGALVTTGCATGSPAVHQGLNDATDLVDPAYQAAVIDCDLQEGEIIAAYPPEEADAADVALAALRVRCDVAFASFQGVRAAQLAVRAALDAKEDGRATTQDVLRSLDELREAQVTARQFVDAIRAARGAP